MTTQEDSSAPVKALTRDDLSDKEKTFLDWVLSFQDDPDFHRIPLPPRIMKVAGIKREMKQISAMEATRYAFNATSINAHQYKGGITIINQSETVNHFPNLTELAYSRDTSENKIQVLEDSSSLPESYAEKDSVLSS